MLLVALSMVSFWLNREATAERIGLGIVFETVYFNRPLKFSIKKPVINYLHNGYWCQHCVYSFQ